MNLRTVAALSLVLGLSAGCSVVRVIEYTGSQNYYDGAFEYATQDGKINTYVAGTPFPTADPEFKNKITSIMYGANFGREVNFVPAKPNVDKHAFHIVVTFNPDERLSFADLCENAAQTKSQPGRETTSMKGVFCQGSHPLSFASGYVSGLTGPADPKLVSLVREVALAMIPRYDDEIDSGPDAIR